MKIGILGSGAVGLALAKGFLAEGHEVFVATREPDSVKAAEIKGQLPDATITDFSSAAQAAEMAVFCVNGGAVKAAISLIGTDNLSGKTVIDTTNMLMPVDGVMQYAGSTVSIAEQIQQWMPESNIVKAFNAVGADTMYKPDFSGIKPTMFIAGNDLKSKQQVGEVVTMFGWEVLDTGSIMAARSLEPMAVIWVNNTMSGAGPNHAFKML